MSDNVDPEKIKETTEATDSATESFKKLMNVINELDKGVKKLGTGLDAANEAMSKSEELGGSLGDRLGDMMGTSSGLNASFSQLASGTLNATDVFGGFTKSLTKNFNAMAIGLSLVEKMFEATTALVGVTDASLVSFQRQTGAVSTYGTKIMALERSLYMYGVTMEEAGESTAALVTGIKNLDEMSPSTQKDLMETTAILNEMGIDSQLTAQNINFLTNSMGLLPEEAASATRSMVALAKELKTPPQEMAAAFQSVGPRLAAFGSKAGAVFQKLAKNAHNANMEIDTMLKISEQFDRFDTAANSVGSLNAALGGPYLSTIRMVTTTDPTDRLKMMSDAARQAGKSFDEMGVYERRMIASAMGLDSVNELALVMAGRFDDVVKPVKLTTEEIIKQEKQLKSYNSITEEFTQLWRSFAVNIAGPLISALKNMLQLFQDMASTSIPFLIAGILLIGAALAPFTSGLTAVMAGVTGVIILFKGLYDLIRASEPAMAMINGVFGMFSERIQDLRERFAALFEGTSDFQSGFDSMVKFMEPLITGFLWVFIDSLVAMAENFMVIIETMNDLGIFTKILYVFAGIAAAVAAAVMAIVTAFTVFYRILAFANRYLNPIMWILNAIHYLIFTGNSPSLLAVFEMLGNAITAVGNAFMFPLKMISKMMTGLKDLASLLAGKALSFISGAISYVFGGGSPETEVNNGAFNRKEDMESMAVSIGDEVAKAVKEALEGVQMNNKIQLEVSAENGLPQLFDYVIRGVDDKYSARPVNHTLNATRAGIK